MGGMRLARQFYRGLAARVLGAVAFTFLLLITIAAFAFAGCLCNYNLHHLQP